MRRRDREINIFNIAFLDVITGAMGAFILLVLLLAPYYTGPNPPPPAMKKVQRAINKAAEQSQKLEKQIEHAIRDGVDPKLLAKLEKLLKKLKAELVAAQRQLIRLRSEVNHLKAQDKMLTDENRLLRRQVRNDRKLIQQLEEEIRQLKAEIQKLRQNIQRQQAKIDYLEHHQGTSRARSLSVLVERVHTPNGRFNAGAPFIVACRTFWKSGVSFNKGNRTLSLHNDPRLDLKQILQVWHFGERLKAGNIPYPHQTDVRLWPVRFNNGPGVATRSPNAMMLQVQMANLRSSIHVWVALLGPGAASEGIGRLNTSAQFMLAAAYGKQMVHKSFRLSYHKPAIRFTFTPLPKEKMNFVLTPFGLASGNQVTSYGRILGRQEP